jgi:hypothetical protein
MNFYGAFNKVDELDDGTIKVFGKASSESKDSSGETVLSAAISDALPDYMLWGALREMHGLSAAGTTLKAAVDDDGYTNIEALIVDPIAIAKIKTGVYKGFSIGGKALARDPTDRTIITKLKLNEISLVDRPCNPDATIDLWKADAATEETPDMTTLAPWAPTNKDVLAKAEALAVAAGKPARRNDYVAAARDDLIKAHADTEEASAAAEVAAALAGDGGTQVVEPVAKVDAEPLVVIPAAVLAPTAADAAIAKAVAEVPAESTEAPVDVVAALEASIAKATAAAAPAVGAVPAAQVTPGLADLAKGLAVIAAAPDVLAKGLYTVGWLARIMSDLVSLQQGAAWEAESEGDNSPVVGSLAEQVKGLGASLVAMAQEEVAEVLAQLPTDSVLVTPDAVAVSVDEFAYAERAIDLVKADTDLIEKVGKRNSAGDAAKLQTIHDNAAKLGAMCTDTAKAASDDDIAKVATETARLHDAIAKATTALDDVTKTVAAQAERIAYLEGQPAPAKTLQTPAGVTAISKAADLGGNDDGDAFSKADVTAYLDSLPESERGNVLVKLALKQPMRAPAR